jgi:tetratricopeptide (TPR) repeat protein
MIRKSYSFTKIEDYPAFLDSIENLKEEKRYNEILDLTNDFLVNHYSISSSELYAFSDKELLDLIECNDEPDQEKWPCIADVLVEEGDAYEAQNLREKAAKRYDKALLILMELCRRESTTFTLANHSRIEDIFSRIVIFDLPLLTKLRLFHYLEDRQKYATAEDVLFNMIEESGRDLNIRQEGVKFFERLLSKPDSELKKGNMTREEVEESLTRLKNI